jgi:hypothetical protein
MQANLYTPPKAELADQPLPPGSPIKAVLAGLAIDIGGSLLVSSALGIAYAVSLARTGLNQSEIQAAIQDIPLDSWVSLAGISVGTGLSVLGGYVCSRISRRSNYKLGFVLAGISASFGLLLSYSRYPLLAIVLLAALTLCSVLAGVKLGHSKV